LVCRPDGAYYFWILILVVESRHRSTIRFDYARCLHCLADSVGAPRHNDEAPPIAPSHSMQIHRQDLAVVRNGAEGMGNGVKELEEFNEYAGKHFSTLCSSCFTYSACSRNSTMLKVWCCKESITWTCCRVTLSIAVSCKINQCVLPVPYGHKLLECIHRMSATLAKLEAKSYSWRAV
jgi:hypothetical protein